MIFFYREKRGKKDLEITEDLNAFNQKKSQPQSESIRAQGRSRDAKWEFVHKL